MRVYFLKGLLIGFVCGVPIGAAGAMAIQRTFRFGIRQGLITGLGSSLADCIFACIGVFGLNFISDFLSARTALINFLGGIVVMAMGLSMLFRKETEYKHGDSLKHFLSTFTVGIMNPVAIVAFMVAFSYFGLQGNVTFGGGMTAVMGVFVGTYIWWLILTTAAQIAKKKSREDIMNKVNTIISIVLILLGAVMLIKGIIKN